MHSPPDSGAVSNLPLKKKKNADYATGGIYHVHSIISLIEKWLFRYLRCFEFFFSPLFQIVSQNHFFLYILLVGASIPLGNLSVLGCEAIACVFCVLEESVRFFSQRVMQCAHSRAQLASQALSVPLAVAVWCLKFLLFAQWKPVFHCGFHLYFSDLWASFNTFFGHCSIDASGEAVPLGVRGSLGSKVPFSSHHIKVYGQHDLPLLMITLLSNLCTKALHFPVGPGPDSNIYILQHPLGQLPRLLPSQTCLSALQDP